MKWNIVADSSCDLKTKDVKCEGDMVFSTVPFTINVGDKLFVDDEELDTEKLVFEMENCAKASGSACPSPLMWAEEFKKAVFSVAITISGNLSGSLNSALTGREMALSENKDKKVIVLDSKSTGPEIALCIHKIVEWIKNGEVIESINEKAQKFLQETKTAFALCSFDNLVKNGRMSRIAGFLAKTLGMWGIGIASDEGTIVIKGKSRGESKALAFLLQDMKERGFKGGQVAISHCHNENMAQKLKNAITECWENACVTILNTRGLDSFYAERKGLIIAF